MQKDVDDHGQCLNKVDKPSKEKSHSVQICAENTGFNSGLQKGSIPDGCVTEIAKVPTHFCADGGGPLLGARLTFAPLEESWADRLRETGVNFTQEDLTCLCDYINSSVLMHYYYLFSMSGLSCILKVTILLLVLICIGSYTSIEMSYLLIFFFTYVFFVMMPCFVTVLSNSLLLNFNKASFRQTNTVASLTLSCGFFWSKPSVTLTAYHLEPCKEVVSNLFKTRYLQQSEHSKMDEKKWDRAVHQLVCSCVINIFEIRQFFAKSKTKVHICSKGEKCVCELIVEAVDLSVFPPKVSCNKLRKAYSMFGFCLDIYRHNIMFRYSDNSVDPGELNT